MLKYTREIMCYYYLAVVISGVCFVGLLRVVAAEIPVMPVAVAEAQVQEVPVTLKGSGHLESFSTINIKSRVNGKLEKVLISDGAVVKEGQLLFEIDKIPYKLAVHSAEARLKREIAGSAESAEEAEIARKLYSKEVVSKEKMDQHQALAEEAEADVKVARAELETAKQNLEYCRITAPIAGMLGRKLINAGNLVSAYQDTLITLRDMNTLKVLFSLPANNLRKVSKFFGKTKLKVTVRNPEDDDRELQGEIDYIASTIDHETGMFEVQAMLGNSEHNFWPGEFVKVTVILETRPDTVVIPARALITSSENGKIVYVIKDNKAEVRKVRVGWLLEDNKAVILEGLKAGETVAIAGLFKLYPDAKVKVVSEKDQQ